MSDTALISACGVLIAFCALFVSYWSATTAHRKTILDLFQRRFGVFTQLQEFVSPVVAYGPPSIEDRKKLWRAMAEARFLFGDDVNQYLDGLRDRMEDWNQAELLLANVHATQAERERCAQSNTAAIDALRRFYDEFPRLCEPYMRMDQRIEDGPMTWLRRLLRWPTGKSS